MLGLCGLSGAGLWTAGLGFGWTGLCMTGGLGWTGLCMAGGWGLGGTGFMTGGLGGIGLGGAGLYIGG